MIIVNSTPVLIRLIQRLILGPLYTILGPGESRVQFLVQSQDVIIGIDNIVPVPRIE